MALWSDPREETGVWVWMPCLTLLSQCVCVYVCACLCVHLTRCVVCTVPIMCIFTLTIFYSCACSGSLLILACVHTCRKGGRDRARRDRSDRYWSPPFQSSRGPLRPVCIGKSSVCTQRERGTTTINVCASSQSDRVSLDLPPCFILTDSSKIRHVTKCASRFNKIHVFRLQKNNANISDDNAVEI